MNCAWQALLELLPLWTRSHVETWMNSLQEVRFRIGERPELLSGQGSLFLDRKIAADDLSFVVNMGSKYSPWAAETAASGYITARGGHRIGICGAVSSHNGNIQGIRIPTSLCIRVARDISGIASTLGRIGESLLLIGPPGSGKTTLLRDLIRRISGFGNGAVAVVDERSELFPSVSGKMLFDPGPRTDVLTGCSKADGIEMVLRSMGPSYIAVDEVTNKADCDALVHSAWCGVSVIATAHAGSSADLYARPVYQPLVQSGIFRKLVVLKPDKTWRVEGIHR